MKHGQIGAARWSIPKLTHCLLVQSKVHFSIIDLLKQWNALIRNTFMRWQLKAPVTMFKQKFQTNLIKSWVLF